MPDWSIEYWPQDGIVFVKTFGPLSWEQNAKLITEAVAALCKNNTNKVLVEHLADVKLSVLEIDKIPDFIKGLDVGAEDRAALVYDPVSSGTTILAFLRNILLLSSYRLQLFTDKEKAVAWLNTG